MSEAQARARHQQQVEELCAAAIRAVSGERDVHFRGRRLHRGQSALPTFAPHLHPSLEEDFGSFRGAADGIALRLRLSDAALHERLRPEEPVDRLVFDLLEQIRVESLAPEHLPGVVRNLRHRYRAWSLAFHDARLTASAHGILLYTVAQVCRARVTAEPVLEETAGLIEHTRAALVTLLGHEIAALRRDRHDQAGYAVHALAIARTVGETMRAQASDASAAEEGSNDEGEDDDTRRMFSFLMGMQSDQAPSIATAVSGDSRVLGEAPEGYRVFTTAYDREAEASSLVRQALLREYRERLDRRIAGQGVNLPRLARELKALLARPTRDGWDGGRDEGAIDGRMLARLIASPTERRLFRLEREEPVANVLVTFLVDCSGSMKEHAESVAMLLDIFVRALELAGADSEVLGFTTGAWNGGRAMRDWQRSGRPRHPGRLNETLHLVFKDADVSWRRARAGMAAMLKADLFREGVDGEAVEWACGRMEGRGHDRRLLLVVSDGCPMDTATHLANDAHYLDHHLRQVVARRERTGEVEIYGVGVGLDLSPYYSRSQALDLSAATGNAVFGEIVQMIAGHRQR